MERKDNLEWNLLKDSVFLDRIQEISFAWAVYRTFCNREWLNEDRVRWSCSWRHAGAIVADARGVGESYIDFYMGDLLSDPAAEVDAAAERELEAEFRSILNRLGWHEITAREEADHAIAVLNKLLEAESLPDVGNAPWYESRVRFKENVVYTESVIDRVHRAASRGQVDENTFRWMLDAGIISPEAQRLVADEAPQLAGLQKDAILSQ